MAAQVIQETSKPLKCAVEHAGRFDEQMGVERTGDTMTVITVILKEDVMRMGRRNDARRWLATQESEKPPAKRGIIGELAVTIHGLEG